MTRAWRDLLRTATLAALCACALDAAAVTCSASTAGLAFGPYDLLAPAPLVATTNVRITCSLQSSDGTGTRIVASTVALSSGLAGSFAPRRMGSGANRMSYNVYTSNSYANVWGDGSGGSSARGIFFVLNRSQPSAFRDVTGYGRVPALQDVAVGTYSDALVVTVSF